MVDIQNATKTTAGRIVSTGIVPEMEKSYLDYAMSVIVARALPDVKDGLKPVHRRIIYAMHQMNLTPGGKYSKSAKVVGEVLGKYHPHGDQSVYNAMVRMAQDFSLRYPLVKGQGNFGSIDNDPPAAMRYTEAKMAKIAVELVADITKDTVDQIDNFDGTIKEPAVLPARIPNLILNGADGIAVGMATKIPPHNLGEICQAIDTILDNAYLEIQDQDLEIKPLLKKNQPTEEKVLAPVYALKQQRYHLETKTAVEDLLKIVTGPDFPTAGEIHGQEGIRQMYLTGRGRFIIRGKAEIDTLKNGKSRIVISQIPYQLNKADLVQKIAGLVKDKKVKSITDLRDESDRKGIRIVIEVKKGGRPNSVLNKIYKFTPLQTSYSANLLALVEGVPQTLNLRQILLLFLRHRESVIRRRTLYDLKSAYLRHHILEGLKIALDHLDAIIKTIRSSSTAEDAKNNLIKKFKLTDLQSQAILDMQLRRLAALERQKIEDEYQQVLKTIDDLTAILTQSKRMIKELKAENKDIQKYTDKRLTKIYVRDLKELSEEDLVPNVSNLVTLTKTGYIKRVSKGTYRTQKRGGVGVVGMTTKLEDQIESIFSANTHDYLLYFTNTGKVFQSRVWEVPEGTRQAKGQAIINFINISSKENIQAVLPLSADSQKQNYKYILFATKNGVVKKTSLSRFKNIRQSGLIAIKLDKDDELVWARLTTGQDQVLLVTHDGKCIRFAETDARPMGRHTRGVRGISLKPDDYLVGMDVLPAKEDLKTASKQADEKKFRQLLVVTQHGIGKRTNAYLYPLQKRGGVGVKVSNITSKTGKVAAAQVVSQKHTQVILASKKAVTIKVPLENIPQLGRTTKGVILMRPKANDEVSAMTVLQKLDKKPIHR